MAGEKERVDNYLAMVERLEPDIHPIDASAYYASAAISAKRMADDTHRAANAIIEYVQFLQAKDVLVQKLREQMDRAARPATYWYLAVQDGQYDAREFNTEAEAVEAWSKLTTERPSVMIRQGIR